MLSLWRMEMLFVRLFPETEPHLGSCLIASVTAYRQQRYRGTQAYPSDVAVVPQSILWFLRVIAGKDDGDIVLVKLRG